MNTVLMFALAVVLLAVAALITFLLVNRLESRLARSPRLMMLLENGGLYMAFALAIGLSWFVWDYFPARTELVADTPVEIRPDELPATAAGPVLQAAGRVSEEAAIHVTEQDGEVTAY